MTETLLIIDDDQANCRLIKAIFRAEGMEVVAAHDGQAGIDLVLANPPDILLLDIRMPGLDGLDVLARLKQELPALPVVMLTGHQDLRTAVRATQLGAFDYLTKPFVNDEVVAVVRRALQTRALQLEVEDLRRRLGAGGGLASLMGPSLQVKDLVEQVRTVAETGFTVLVVGETGSRPSSCASSSPGRSSRWAPTGQRRWTSGSSPPPTTTCSHASPRGSSGPTCTSGWRSTPSPSRP